MVKKQTTPKIKKVESSSVGTPGQSRMAKGGFKKTVTQVSGPSSIISMDDIEKHLEKYMATWQGKLRRLEQELIEPRDKGVLPIHVTKWRVKSPESIYTKVKRYSVINLKDITDYAGFRVLCLFDEDIVKVHLFLLQVIKKGGNLLKNLNLFNWDQNDKNTKVVVEAAKRLNPKLPAIRYKPRRPESGYRSVHYTCSFKEGDEVFYFEIQLRTILQDAWAELEHSLSYKKGRVHPYIRKNFDLLAKDLVTSDELMNYLKRLSSGYQQMEAHSMTNAGPHQYFEYEDAMMSEIFAASQKRKPFEDYLNFVKKQSPKECKTWMPEAQRLYSSLEHELGGDILKLKEIRYFMQMERAYLHFCSGESQKAFRIYKDLYDGDDKDEYQKRGVLLFRMGEARFIQGNIVKALEYFDRSEQQMKPDSVVNRINTFRLKMKLANIYWMLGPEYAEIAHRQIIEAKKIHDSAHRLFSAEAKLHLLNNSCWYCLEKFLLSGKDDDYCSTKEAFNKLKVEVATRGNKFVSSNQYDTLAWCSYQFYVKEGNPDDLEQAKKWCPQILQTPNQATFKLTSSNLQIQHIHEILSAE